MFLLEINTNKVTQGQLADSNSTEPTWVGVRGNTKLDAYLKVAGLFDAAQSVESLDLPCDCYKVVALWREKGVTVNDLTVVEYEEIFYKG